MSHSQNSDSRPSCSLYDHYDDMLFIRFRTSLLTGELPQELYTCNCVLSLLGVCAVKSSNVNMTKFLRPRPPEVNKDTRRCWLLSQWTPLLISTVVMQTQIISSFHLCSDLVTAFIHYFRTSKLLILSSATLELALICLTAVINCANSHLSTDVSFAAAIDMTCSVGHICVG